MQTQKVELILFLHIIIIVWQRNNDKDLGKRCLVLELYCYCITVPIQPLILSTPLIAIHPQTPSLPLLSPSFSTSLPCTFHPASFIFSFTLQLATLLFLSVCKSYSHRYSVVIVTEVLKPAN